MGISGCHSLCSTESGFLSSLLPAQQLSRTVPFQWLVPRSGIGYMYLIIEEQELFSFFVKCYTLALHENFVLAFQKMDTGSGGEMFG